MPRDFKREGLIEAAAAEWSLLYEVFHPTIAAFIGCSSTGHAYTEHRSARRQVNKSHFGAEYVSHHLIYAPCSAAVINASVFCVPFCVGGISLVPGAITHHSIELSWKPPGSHELLITESHDTASSSHEQLTESHDKAPGSHERLQYCVQEEEVNKSDGFTIVYK